MNPFAILAFPTLHALPVSNGVRIALFAAAARLSDPARSIGLALLTEALIVFRMLARAVFAHQTSSTVSAPLKQGRACHWTHVRRSGLKRAAGARITRRAIDRAPRFQQVDGVRPSLAGSGNKEHDHDDHRTANAVS